MQKITIYCLFDDGSMSTSQAIWNYIKKYPNLFNELSISIYSFGINEKEVHEEFEQHIRTYKKINLSIDNPNLLKEFKPLPKPTILLASPPCESWSICDGACRMVQDIQPKHWEIRNKAFYEHWNTKKTRRYKRYFWNKEISRINGERTIGATVYLIEHLKPKVYVIENPQASFSWKYQEHHLCFYGLMNLAFYYNYDSSFSRKATIFKSNIDLELKHVRQDNKVTAQEFSDCWDYDKRSRIPHQLIEDIFTKSLKYVKDNTNE